MPQHEALHAQLLDLPDDDLDELLDQVLEERRGPIAEDEEAIDEKLSGSGRPMTEIEDAVETANEIAATLEDAIQKEYGGLTEDALRSMLLALIGLWLRNYWSQAEDGTPTLAARTLVRTLEPEISRLADPLIARGRIKLN